MTAEEIGLEVSAEKKQNQSKPRPGKAEKIVMEDSAGNDSADHEQQGEKSKLGPVEVDHIVIGDSAENDHPQKKSKPEPLMVEKIMIEDSAEKEQPGEKSIPRLLKLGKIAMKDSAKNGQPGEKSKLGPVEAENIVMEDSAENEQPGEKSIPGLLKVENIVIEDSAENKQPGEKSYLGPVEAKNIVMEDSSETEQPEEKSTPGLLKEEKIVMEDSAENKQPGEKSKLGPVEAENFVMEDSAENEQPGEESKPAEGKTGKILNKHRTLKNQLAKFDCWTRDKLRFAKNRGMLTNPFSIDEAFEYLELQYEHTKPEDMKIDIKTNSEETSKNYKSSMKNKQLGTRRNSVSPWILAFCFLMTHSVKVVAQQLKGSNDFPVDHNQYLLWVLLGMTILLLFAILAFMMCHSCSKKRSIVDVEEQPFIVKCADKEVDVPSIVNLRHRLFGRKNISPRQKGGGSGDDDIQTYEVDRNLKIGSGRMSNVFIASYNGKQVAAKIFQGFDNRTKNVLEKEYRILKKLKHENIIEVIHFDKKQDTLLLELCYVTDGKGEKIFDLKEWSQKCEDKSALAYASILKQATAALNYLHHEKVLHSDVKPQNILCTGDFHFPLLKMTGDFMIDHKADNNVNVSDFGSAMREAIQELAVSKVSGIGGVFGTDLYRAPETFKRNNAGKTKSNDVYSLAFTLADILNETPVGENLYGKELIHVDTYTIMQVKQENIVPEFRIPQVCDNRNIEEVSTALKTCLDGDPNKRIDSDTLCKIMHMYHSKIDPNVMKSPLPKKIKSQNVRLGTEKSNVGSQAMNTVDNKTFLNFETEMCSCESIDLHLSQATPGIMIVFKDEAHVDYAIPEVNHLRLLLQDETQFDKMKRFEGTNACAFYSCLIMDQILLLEDWTMEEAIARTRQIIMLSQLDFNHKRNTDNVHSVEEAIGILGKKLILNLRDYEDLQHGKGFKPRDENDLLQILSNFFINVKDVMKDVKHGFFYTVGELIFSFVINYMEGTATLIDTHQLPHIENAVICRIDLKNKAVDHKEKPLAEAMSMLLKKRIFASKGHTTYDVFHQVDLVTQDLAPVNNETQEELQDVEAAPDFNIGEIMEVEVDPVEDAFPHDSFMESDPVHTSTPIQVVLRDYQQEVLKKVLESKDILMVWPTGAGKSHTIISIIEETHGASIILTPTLSLMMEYMEQLETRSISYLAGSSLQAHSHQASIVEICKNTPRCILATHEEMDKWGDEGLTIINEANQIQHIIYDEIHCDVLWGGSLRPSMNKVHNLPESLASAKRIALTATPMGGTIEETVQSAKLRQPFVSKRSLFRANIKLEVFTTQDIDVKTKLLLEKVLSPQKSIIFTAFTDEAQELVRQFRAVTELPVFLFIGTISNQLKTTAFDDFKRATSGIMIATHSLGMILYLCQMSFVNQAYIHSPLIKLHQRLE